MNDATISVADLLPVRWVNEIRVRDHEICGSIQIQSFATYERSADIYHTMLRMADILQRACLARVKPIVHCRRPNELKA